MRQCLARFVPGAPQKPELSGAKSVSQFREMFDGLFKRIQTCTAGYEDNTISRILNRAELGSGRSPGEASSEMDVFGFEEEKKKEKEIIKKKGFNLLELDDYHTLGSTVLDEP